MRITEIFRDKEKRKEVIVYGIFGVLTTGVSFGSFYILRKIFVYGNENILNAFSILLAILFAYVTNRRFVFKSKEQNLLKEFLKFIGSRAVSALFEIVSFFLLKTIFNWDGMLIKAIVSFIVILLNYIMSKLFVFK